MLFGNKATAAHKWVREEYARRDDARRLEFRARLDALVEEAIANQVGSSDIMDALVRRAEVMRMWRATNLGVDARL
jgi:hypothetical protein